jgi:L-lysine exporter family protein LysE/ArgO
MIQTATPFLLGLILGLALIIPIGVQSLFVLNQGLVAGFPRAFVGVAAVCFCDTFLIVLGAAGASALLALLGYQELLIAVGSIYLLVMGVLTLRARPQHSEGEHLTRIGATVVQAVGVSVLNPHAILDTVGVLGAAIAAQAAEGRVTFVAGAVGASWVWYSVIGVSASVLQKRITPRVRLWIQRTSGAIMLVLAGVLVSGPA